MKITTETKGLHEKKARLVTQMQDILRVAKEDNGRSLTKEESERFDKLDTDMESIASDIKRISKVHELTSSDEERIREEAGRTGNSADQIKDTKEKQNRAFSNFLRVGLNDLSKEEKEIMGELRVKSQQRAQSVGTTTAGGFLVPEDFNKNIDIALLEFGGVREVATIIKTAIGSDMPWPKVDDSSNVGELLAENTQLAAQDVTFGSVTMKSYKYSSKNVLVSNELIQDGAVNIDQLLTRLLTERIGRITNTHFTTGDNSSKPNGIVTASTSGKTTAAEGAFTALEIMDLEHSVDPAYRKSGKAKFMLHDTILKEVKKLVIGSADNRPLWDPAILKMGTPATILGYEYVINQDMASSLVADAKVMLFGDFSRYIIRDVRGFDLLRLVERYADYDQVGFFGFMRTDGRLVSGGTPYKHLTMANT